MGGQFCLLPAGNDELCAMLQTLMMMNLVEEAKGELAMDKHK
jgi:hypothetical protein